MILVDGVHKQMVHYFFITAGKEIPYKRGLETPNLDTYRGIPVGLSYGLKAGFSMVNGRTWITKTQPAPSMTDLYKSRPGGY